MGAGDPGASETRVATHECLEHDKSANGARERSDQKCYEYNRWMRNCVRGSGASRTARVPMTSMQSGVSDTGTHISAGVARRTAFHARHFTHGISRTAFHARPGVASQARLVDAGTLFQCKTCESLLQRGGWGTEAAMLSLERWCRICNGRKPHSTIPESLYGQGATASHEISTSAPLPASAYPPAAARVGYGCEKNVLYTEFMSSKS